MGSNYLKMVEQARELFLAHDQAAIIGRWSLAHDAKRLCFRLFSERMALDRRTAALSSLETSGYVPADYVHESMVVFDLLTLSPERPRAAGRWASISTLGGIIGAGHDRTLGHDATAARFDGHLDALRGACVRLGGAPLGKADVGYVIPVFEDFGIWFQYWEGDDEFPSAIKYLFDENALQFMHYETLWYVMGALDDRLLYYSGVKP